MTRVPYRCNSWRCPGCARHEAAVCFRRISDACAPLPAEGWVFMVLTLDRHGYYGKGTPERAVVDALSALAGVPSRWAWQSADVAYRALGGMTEALRRRLARWAKREGWEQTENRWVAVVEAHRSGWPHVNVLVYAPGLAAELREQQGSRDPSHVPACRCSSCRRRVLLSGELLEAARRSGFGAESTAECLLRGTDTAAGYITKLVALAGEASGEVAKITQAPLAAPERFRRLRSGRKFLPPRVTNPAVTGTLVRRRVEHDGTTTVLPLHAPPIETATAVPIACAWEDDLAHVERRLDVLGKDPAWRVLAADHRPGAVLQLSFDRARGPPLLPEALWHRGHNRGTPVAWQNNEAARPPIEPSYSESA